MSSSHSWKLEQMGHKPVPMGDGITSSPVTKTKQGDTGSAEVQKKDLLKLLCSALGTSLEISSSPSQFNGFH